MNNRSITMLNKNQFSVRCPFCEGSHFRRYGYSKAKAQRYLCCDCNRTFQNKYIYVINRLKVAETVTG
ncbi:transposase [Limnobaculum allomyrinae]